MFHFTSNTLARTFTAALLFFAISVSPSRAASALPESFANLVEELMPAVVNISSTQVEKRPQGRKLQIPDNVPQGHPLEEFRDFFEQFEQQDRGDNGEPSERKATSLGSGFVIDPDGYIVTNYHVVADAEEITVNFSNDKQAKGTVIGFDKKTDLALIKVDVDHKLPHVEFGDSDKSRVGDWVIAIGNPFGLGGSVSVGIVSARSRDINAGPFDDFIQTDAAINKGNSGGPMFNADGKVIGINTAIFSPSGGSVGIGFATPSSLANPVIKQLKKHGRTIRAWLGVKIQTVTEDIAESIGLKEAKGALVVEVTKGSPSDKAGINVGDVILSFDGKDITSMRKLPRLVADSDIGKKTSVQVWKNGTEQTVEITLGELKEDQAAADKELSDKNDKPDIKGKTNLLSMGVVTLNKDIRKEFNLSDSITQGVLVLSVKSGSSADEKGIRSGDVIVSANQVPVASTADLKKAIDQSLDGKRKSILLLVNRQGDTIFIALPTAEKPEKKKEKSAEE